jgi:mannose-1-phosphate guanylyltransferase
MADGASVGPGVSVGAGAKIGAGAKVQQAAIFEDTEVVPGETLTEVLAWGSHRISAPLTRR